MLPLRFPARLKSPRSHETRMAGHSKWANIKRREDAHAAMRCRGFHGTFYSLKTFSWQRRDRIFLAASLLALTGLLYLEWQRAVLL